MNELSSQSASRSIGAGTSLDIRHHALTNAKFRDASFGAVQCIKKLQ